MDSVTMTENDGQGHNAVTAFTRQTGQTTVVRPDNSKIVVLYNGNGQPTDEKDYDVGGTTLLKEISRTFTGNYPATATTFLNGAEISETDTQYDTYGNLTSKTVIDWARDSSGQTKQVTTIGYLNGSSYISANILDRPTSILVQDGHLNELSKTTINYDSYSSIGVSNAPMHDSAYGTTAGLRGNPTSVIRAVNSSQSLTTSYTYDDAGNVLSITDPNGHTRTIAYGNCGAAYPSQESAPGGDVYSIYECARGTLQNSTDQNGVQTSYSFDVYGRPTGGTNPDGGSSTVSYPNPNEVDTSTAVDATQSVVSKVTSDGFGRPILQQTQAPSGWDTVQTTRDIMGRPASVSNPYNGTTPVTTTTTYDGLGRPLVVTAPDGSATTHVYSANAMRVSDARGVSRVLQADGLGRLWQVCEVSGQAGSAACNLAIAANGFLTTYTYDMAGRLTGVAQSGQTRSWTYDELGRPLSQSDPESGATSYAYDSVADSICPNSSSNSPGDLVLTTDASSMKTCLQYDVWHRVTAKAFSTGQTYTYSWDGTESYGLGRLSGATSPDAFDSFVYDNMGRPTSVTESISGLSSYTADYAYNYLGEPTSLTAPSGSSINYSYDRKGRLSQVAGPSNTPVYLGSRSFNAADQVTQQSFGGAALSFTAQYNNDLQPWQLSYSASGGAGLTLQYVWGTQVDASGNVTSGDENGTLRKLVDATDNNRTISYTYDDLNRIASAVQTDGSINASFSIDPVGNLWSSSFPDDQSQNRLTGLIYDPAGRITGGSWGGVSNRSFTWDPEGKLLTYSDAGTSTIRYSYDAFGRRVKATPSSGAPTYYFYGAGGGDHPIAEYTSSWQTDIQADGSIVATVDGVGNVTYLAQSMLRTTKMTVNGSGAASGVATYYPYGAQNASIAAEYTFTNQMRDPNGIDHFWMRSYAPDLGRWLTPDPAGLAAADPADPQSWNRYAYVGNQPTTGTDPTGLLRPFDGDTGAGGGLRIITHGIGEGCTADGIDSPCNSILDTLLSGAGVECPNDDCGIGTRTPFTCLEDNCGNMSLQYASTHAYTCGVGLPCTQKEHAQYEQNIEAAQAAAVADWLNNWAVAVGCTQCPAIDASDLKDARDQGGHPNFDLSRAFNFYGWSMKPGAGRYGGLNGSVHIENKGGDLQAHFDTANPLSFFPIGLAIHAYVDVFGGTLAGLTRDYLP